MMRVADASTLAVIRTGIAADAAVAQDIASRC